MGEFPKKKKEFQEERFKILKRFPRLLESQDGQLEYIRCVLKNEDQLSNILNQNEENLFEQLGITREKVRASETKNRIREDYYKFFQVEETLKVKVPKFLDKQKALRIKEEMKNEALIAQNKFYETLEAHTQVRPGDRSQLGDRRLEYDDIMNATQTFLGGSPDDQDNVIKASSVASHFVLDIVLTKKYNLTEAALKRILHKNHFDEEQAKRSFLFWLKRKIFG